MNCFAGNTSKVAFYIQHLRKIGIEVLPPDINRSGEKFSVELHDGKEAVRFGMNAVKNVGVGAIKAIVDEVKKTIPNIDTSFVVSTIDYLYKGGRVTGMAAVGAKLLNIRPSIELTHGIMTPGKKYRGKLDKCVLEYVRDQLDRFGDVAGTLSGGEQQMLAMGRALMSHPTVLMLDEPSMGLSPILVDQIFEIIKELHEQGTTILLVEQNAKKSLSIADRAYVLETGRITMEGKASDLMNDPRVKKAYLGA